MSYTEKIIGTGLAVIELAVTGLIRAGVGIGEVFGALILCVLVVSAFSLLGLYLSYDIAPIVKPMSGVRYPTYTANGQESWVIPGKTCGYCGTGC